MLELLNKQIQFGELLPPVWVNCGGMEVFRDDVLALVEEIKSSKGGNVELVFGENCPHIYPMMWPLFQQEGEHALQSFAAFCLEKWVPT